MRTASNFHRAGVILFAFLSFTISMLGCRSGAKESTALSGQCAFPKGKTLRDCSAAAVRNGKEAASAPIDPVTGNFLIKLPGPGTYDIRLKTPRGNLDFAAGVSVREGQQAGAGVFPAPVDLFEGTAVAPEPPAAVNIKLPAAEEGSRNGPLATLRGQVHPAEAQIKILSGDKVIAQGVAKGGKFEIASVPAGVYDVEYSAAGYATAYQQNVPVSEEGALQNLNGFLLYASDLDGVDWKKGTMTATGLGKPNPGMSGPQAGLMACRAAKTVAYRNLLNTLLEVQVEPGKSIKMMGSENVKSKLTGFVQGARVVAEKKRGDGACEVTLQIPIHGPSSVANFIQTNW